MLARLKNCVLTNRSSADGQNGDKTTFLVCLNRILLVNVKRVCVSNTLLNSWLCLLVSCSFFREMKPAAKYPLVSRSGL